MPTHTRLLALLGLLALATIADAQGVQLSNGTAPLDTLKFEDGFFVHPKGEVKEIVFDKKDRISGSNWGDVRFVYLITGEMIQAEVLELDDKTIRLKTLWNEKLEVPRSYLRNITRGRNGALVREIIPDPTKNFTMQRTVKEGNIVIELNKNAGGSGTIAYEKESFTFKWDTESVLFQRNDHVVSRPLASKTGTMIVLSNGPFESKETFFCNTGGGGSSGMKFQKFDATANTVKRVQEFSTEIFRSKPSSDPKQDRMTLHNGDELFGQIVSIKNGECQFRSTRLRTYGVHEFRELLFQTSELNEKTTQGEHVRLISQNWNGDWDFLTGVITGYTSEKITFAHPALGDIVFTPKQLQSIKVIFSGERVPLAPKKDVKFSLKGHTEKKIDLEINAYSPLGNTKWEVWLNGSRIGTLDKNKTPRSQLIPLFADSIREDNNLEIRPRYEEGVKPDPLTIESINLRIHRK